MKKMMSFAVALAAVAVTSVASAEVPVPADYTQISWIQSSGQEWIDTFASATGKTRFEISFRSLSPTAKWGTFFGASTTGSPGNGVSVVLRYFSTEPNFQAFYCDTEGATVPDVANTDITVVLQRGSMQVNGKTYWLGNSDKEPFAGNKIYLFCAYKKDAGEPKTAWKQAMRLYSFKMSEIGMADDGTETVTPVRDFVPCISPEGELGLWDKVQGQFYDNRGEGAFIGPEVAEPASLNWLQSSGTEFIDIGTNATRQTRIEASFNPLKPSTSWGAFFGAAATSDPPKGEGSVLLRYYSNSAKMQGFFCNRTSDVQVDGMSNTNVTAILEHGSLILNGVTNAIPSEEANPTPNNIWVFNYNNNGLPSGQKQPMRLYSFKMSDVTKLEEGGETVTPVRDLVPYRTAEREIGLLDRLSGTFYSQNGTGKLTYGLAYVQDGTTLKAYDGTLVPSDLPEGCETVNKMTAGELDASGMAVFPALTLSEGVLSVQDGEVMTHAVSGRLTLKGGTTLRIDLRQDACDCIEADEIDMSEASSANPVRIEFPDTGATFVQPYVVFRSNGLTAEMADKFVVSGADSISVRVEDGELFLAYDDPSVATIATWTGNGDPDDVYDVRNWDCVNGMGNPVAAYPTAATRVILPDGCAFNCPADKPISSRKIQYPAYIDGDSDWRGLSAPIDGTIDLRGHKLYISHLDGTGTITDKSQTSGYQRLTYIDSDGTAYINTEYYVQSSTRIEARFAPFASRSGGWGTFFGVTTSNYPAVPGTTVLVRYFSKTGGFQAMFAGTATYDSPETEDFMNKDVTVLLEKGGLTINGEYHALGSPNVPYPDPIYIFCANNIGSPYWLQAMRLYSFKIYDGDLLERDFVPVKRLVDGALGLLDVANGREVFYGNANTGGAFTQGPVLPEDAASAVGELHLDVAAGRTVTGASLKIAGDVRLVKEGEGEYRAALKEQDYLGGLEILGGTVVASLDGTQRSLGAAGGLITIGKGGRLDMGGNHSFCEYGFVLNGGEWVNSKPLVNNLNYGQAAIVRVTDDSAIDFNGWSVVGMNFRPTLLDLGGHTVRMSTSGECSFVQTTATAGTLAINGPIKFAKGGFEGRETTLDHTGGMSVEGVSVHLGDYIARGTATDVTGDGEVVVYRRFKPVSDNFWGCVLKDGVTLDLSERNSPMNVRSAFTGTSKTVVTFENNATIGIDLGTRKVQSDEALILWDDETRPANFESLNFHLVSGQPGRLLKSPSGVYLLRGIVLRVH